jgi:PAT family beta-lactamase induction signal transducer AmpG
MNKLPALSENAFLRYFNFIVLYIAQGIPEGMILFGIPAWFAMNGKTPGEIGSFVAAFGLPWSFKIIIAPLMDRFTYLPMGRKRPWVIFGQFGLILSFIALAFISNPLNNLNSLMIAVFFVGCFGAFQDVATDGMAIDIIPLKQQARANGFMWGAKIIGTSTSLALGSWLLNYKGFEHAILMLSSAVACIILVPLFLRERPSEKLLPWTQGETSIEALKVQLSSWSIIFKSLFSVFKLKNSLVLALILFIGQGAFNYFDTVLSIFAIKGLGWTDLAYSQTFATASLVGGIGGMLIGGILIDKFGKVKMLNIYYLALIVMTSCLAFLKIYWPYKMFLSGMLISYQILYVFAVIGIFAISMEFCWKKVSASQFTLYMTIGNLGRIVGAKIIGPIKEQFSWDFTLLFFALFIFINLILIQLINIKNHTTKLDNLEEKDKA